MSGDDFNIGQLVAGRYRLDDLLGRGGFGSVYRGWDTQIGRDVAVKLLDVANGARSAKQTAELRERFRREAMAAGRINHRGVVTIYDFGIPEDGGEAFLVMELLEGRDLAEELALNGPMLPDRAQRLLVPMLEALGRGHELGIVHKDIKPQNIFLSHPETNSEAFCLVDFGVARVMHEDKLTMTGLIVGTPQYMAPEYITDTLVTPALDVYQMALILVELITGAPAVPGGESFVKSCNRHFTGDLAVPEELYEGEFGKLLREALLPNPKDRLPDALEFARRLSEIDPSSIAVDTQATMVFVRRVVDTYDEPPLFSPMRPEQVSAELERLADDSSGVLAQPADTPLSVASPHVTAPVEVLVAAVTEPARVIVPARAIEFAATVPPPQNPPLRATFVEETDVEIPVVTPPQPPSLSPAIIALTVVGLTLGGGLLLMVMGKDKPPPAPVGELSSPTPLPLKIEKPAMTQLRTVPTGASVLIRGVEVGRTPLSVAIGRAEAAELLLDGYEPAVVKLAESLDPVTLKAIAAEKPPQPKEQPSTASPKKPPREQPFEGRVFDPELESAGTQTPAVEPEVEPEEPEVKPEEPEVEQPKKFVSPPVKRWKKPSALEIAK